jgi:hypothetical protein
MVAPPRHSGAMRSIEPGISRFRIALPRARNDGPKTSQPGPRVSDALEGAVALKQEAQSPPEKLEGLHWSKAGAAHAQTAPSEARTPC